MRLTYRWSEASKEWLLFKNGVCCGWVREDRSVEQPFIFKVYGHHPGVAGSLTQALKFAAVFVR